MEGLTAQILIGTLFLSATIIALVKIISAFLRRREKLEQRKDDGARGHGQYEKVATEDEDEMEIADDGHSNDEVVRKSNDILEEHMTIAQECLVVILCGTERAAAVCLFRNDAAVEYFVEDISECRERKCSKALQLQSDLAHRVVMAALAAWSEKWYFAEAVNVLCQEGSVVRDFNREGSHAHRQLRKMEKKFSYKLFFQWTENYICDEVAEEDLWERTISLTKELLTPGGSSEDAIWRRFPLGYWPRRRIHLSMEHFQQ